MDLTGKVAIVTGAAAGIGRASSVALAKAGCGAVALADVDVGGMEETARLVDDAGARSLVVPTDVSDLRSLMRLYATVEDRFGGVDIVHNNAGIQCGDPSWPATPPERMQKMVEVNLTGVVLSVRLAIDALRRRGGGAVVNTASIAGYGPLPDDPTYSATKAAVINFTASCAGLAEEGIRVTAVAPGVVDTPMLTKTGPRGRTADWLQPIVDNVNLLSPDEIAAAVIELILSDKAGETVMVMNR